MKSFSVLTTDKIFFEMFGGEEKNTLTWQTKFNFSWSYSLKPSWIYSFDRLETYHRQSQKLYSEWSFFFFFFLPQNKHLKCLPQNYKNGKLGYIVFCQWAAYCKDCERVGVKIKLIKILTWVRVMTCSINYQIKNACKYVLLENCK